MKQFLWILIFFIQDAHGAEKSESFVIKVYDHHFKVTAPSSFDPVTRLLIENHTLTKIYGKVETKSERLINYVSILPKNFKSLPLNLTAPEKIIFIPLVPSLQEVELVFGKEAYEIPPQK